MRRPAAVLIAGPCGRGCQSWLKPEATAAHQAADARGTGLASHSSKGVGQVGKTKDVRAAVEKELGFDPRVDSAHITVSNISGDVTLTGTAPSYPQYLAATAAARRVAGVTGVHNHLEVVLPEGDYRDDVKLATAANNALAQNVT